MNQEYISANQLSIKLGAKEILKSLDFAVSKGDCVAIIGANGSGKTTLIKVLCGLLPASPGALQIADMSYTQPQQALPLRKLIGYAPDYPPLYNNDTVYEYLHFIAELKMIPKLQIKDRLEYCLQTFALTAIRDSRIGSLSKGTQQRVNLAQAILHEPKILIMDEPTNALDPDQCENFCNFIKQMRSQKITILLASHHYNEIIPLCDYMLRIANQTIEKILTPSSTKEILHTHEISNHTT